MPDEIPHFDDWVKTRTPRERVFGAARSEGIPDDIAEDYLKVTSLESGHKLNAPNSSKGARGFGQVMPDVKGGNVRTVGNRQYDLRDPDQNITAGLRYFAEGGEDPVARRLHYFGGPKARQRYERTGRIPNISDGNMTAAQYVQATGGQRHPPKFDEWTPESGVPKFDEWTKDSEQNLPAKQRVTRISATRNPPVTPKQSKATSAPNIPIEEALKRLSQQVTASTDQLKRQNADTGMGRLRQIDEPEVARIQRLQREETVRSKGAPTLDYMGSVPGRRESRVAQIAARRASEERATEESRRREAPELDRLTQEYRQQIREAARITPNYGPTQWFQEALHKGEAGLLELGAAGARAFTGASRNPEYTRQVADKMRLHAEAMQRAAIEEGADRNVVSQTLQDATAGLISTAPELAAMSLGAPPIATFAVGGGARAYGRGGGVREVAKEAAHGAATGAIFELPIPSRIQSPAGRVAAKAGTVGAATTGMELATGTPAKEAISSGITNAAFAGYGELKHGGARPGASDTFQAGSRWRLPNEDGAMSVVRSQEGIVTLENRNGKQINVRVNDLDRLARQGQIIPETQPEKGAPANDLPETAAPTSHDKESLSEAGPPQVEAPEPVREAAKRYHDLAGEMLLLNQKLSEADRPDSGLAQADIDALWQRHTQAKREIVRLGRFINEQGYDVNYWGDLARPGAPFPASSRANPERYEAAEGVSQSKAEPAGLRQWQHADFGLVTESPNQRRVGKGRVRVVGENGREHIIKRAALTGAGNQRAIPIKNVGGRPEESGEALILDENGNPLTVYHHTTKEAKDAILKSGFDLSKGRARLSDEAVPDGVFFTPSDKTPFRDPDVEFSRIDANLQAANPLRVENRDEIRQWASERSPEYAAVTKELSRYTFDEMDRLYGELQGTDKAAAQRAEQELQGLNQKATRGRAILTDLLKRNGYDSLIMERDEAGPQVTKTYVVLDPKQVRIKKDANTSGTPESEVLIRQQAEPAKTEAEVANTVKQGEATGFTTSQGSSYAISGESTQRTKTPHVGHDPKDVGLKRPSDRTLYLDEAAAREVGMWNTLSATGKRVIVQGDEVWLTSINPKSGKRGLDGRFKFASEPEIGKSPLELWDRSESLKTEGREGYRGNHPGNPIKEIQRRAPSAIEQAFADWRSRRAYIDGNGNYHVKTEGGTSGPIAPWNKAVKQAFKTVGEFHAAAHKAESTTEKQASVPDQPDLPENVQTRLPEEASTTSLRKAQMAEDRAALDLPELPEAQRKSWQQSLDNARSKGLDRKADVLANEVLQQPRALNDEESAGLVLRAQELKNEHARVMREIGEATDPEAIKAKTAERDAIEASFDKVSRAAKLSGTEKARALTAQKLTINQDYDLVSVISRAKAAKGRDLTAPERAQYEELVTKYKVLEDQLAELRTQRDTKSSQESVDKFVREQSVSLRRQRRQRTTETLKAERADLKNQISALVKGASVKEFFKSEEGEFDPKHATELTRLLTALARNYIESGVVKAEALVDVVHSEIKDVTELTKREVSDLISGYGQIRKPTSDPVEKKLTELKAILAATSGRVDVLEKSMRPLRRGQQREKPTEDQRRALRDLQEAMREKGPDLASKPYDSSREQATPLDKAKTTARNRIEQLRKWIEEGKKEVQGQKRVIPDAELTQLRAERDALEKATALLDDPVADQRTIERRVSALEQSIKVARERIASGQLQPDVKEGRSARWSQEIGQLERERRTLQRILSDMKRDAARQQREQERSKPAEFYGAEKTWAEFEAEAKRILNRRRHLEKRLSELEQQLASGNIEAPKPRPERMPTEEEFRLERRITDAKRKIEERLSNDGETSLGRLARRVGDVLGLYRAIETSFDVSWALRQGKIGLARHPTFWSKAFIEQFKGLSNDKYFRAAKEIENDPDFRYLNKFGLETPSVDSIHAGSPTYTRAEEFQTELAHKIPGLKQSEQVYNIGLDTLKVMWAKHDLQMLRKAGFNPEKPADFKVFKEAMQSINDATGRTSLGRLIPGKLGEAANRATPAINQLTYAVRFWASRLKVLSSPLDPRMYPQPEFAKRYYESLPRVQRVEAWKRLFAFYGLWGAQAAAMKYLLGFDLELDPDSPDFGKFRRGNRVYDFSAGMVNHLRFAARMARRVYEAKTGQEPKSSAVDTLGTYLRSKESPVAGRVHDIFLSKQTKEGYGTDFKGDPVYPFGKPDSGFFGRLKTARLFPKPLGLDDAMEAYDQMGWGGVAGSVPASVLGEGVQTYPKKENKQLKRRQTREKMTDQMRHGEPIDVDAAVSAGELTESDRKRIQRDAKLSERQARFNDYQSSTALDRFERMDANQQEEVRDLMEKKAYTLLHSDSLTQEQKEGFAARIDALGLTPENPRASTSGGFRSRLKGFNSAFREAP